MLQQLQQARKDYEDLTLLPAFTMGLPTSLLRIENGWYAGGGIDYMVYSGTLVDLILGVEYQHIALDSKSAFCGNPSCTATSTTSLSHVAASPLRGRSRAAVRSITRLHCWPKGHQTR